MQHSNFSSRRLRFCELLTLAIFILFPYAGLAQTPAPLTLNPSMSTIQYRVTLAGAEGTWESGPANATAELDPPDHAGDSLALRNIHFSVSTLSCPVGLPGSAPINVALTNITVDAAVGAGIVVPAQLSDDGLIYSFSSDFVVPVAASGHVYYSASGLGCNDLQHVGGPCSGPFTLAPPASSAMGQIVSGSISAGGEPRSASLVLYASIPIVAGTTWGTLDVRADLRGTLSPIPTCAADFNHQNGLTVQDIFDFLTAWFAGAAGADFDHSGGLSVQDIFGFLSAWFAGC